MGPTPDLSEAEAVKIGEDLLRDQRFTELIEHCRKHAEHYDGNPALWRLLGVAHGNLGNPHAARMSFLNALLIDPSEARTLANYILACFDAGDKTGGIKAINRFFGAVDFNGQKIILETLAESVATGFIAADDLPATIRPSLEQIAMSESPIDEFAVEVNGVQIIYHETETLPTGSGYEISHVGTGMPVAVIAGSRFEKSRSTTVFVLSSKADSWITAGLNPNAEVDQLRQAIEALAHHPGKNFASLAQALPSGFSLRQSN